MTDWKATKGDSTDTKLITIKGIDDYTHYRGDVTVLDRDRVATGFTAVLTPDIVDGFTVALTPAHTEALEVGMYIVVFEVTKEEVVDVPTYRREMSWQLDITESLINL